MTRWIDHMARNGLTNTLPKSVKVCEAWARDGLQGERSIIPVEQKIKVIDAFTDLRLKRIETTSFSHPKLIPQFADSMEVLRGIKRAPDATYIALAPNMRGMQRLVEAQQAGYGVQEVIVVISASEAHVLANLDKTQAEALVELDTMIKLAHDAGIRVNACIGTAFGCPLTGDVPVQKVIDLINWYKDRGCTLIMIGDTTGEANPLQVKRVFATLLDKVPDVDYIAHFHDTRGAGIANAVAALEAGIVYHDSSFGGLGGQPATNKPVYHRGLTGNVATEDLISVFEEMGVDTGVDPDRAIEVAELVEDVCGRQLMGKITRGAGRPRRRRDEELLYDDLKPGKQFAPAFFYIEPDMVKEFAAAVGDDNSIYFDEEYAKGQGFDGVQAHPAFAAIFLRKAYLVDRKMPPGGILAKQEMDFLQPLKPRDILTSYATVVERYKRKERKYVVISVETLRSDGQPVCRGKITAIWPK